MIFKFLEKPITIKAIVSEEYSGIVQYHPILPSSKFVPQWWKNTPKSEFDVENWQQKTTTKSCLGIIGTYQTGYIMPLWSDLAINIDENGNWKYQFSDEMSKLDCHSNSQAPDFYKDYNLFKIVSPWLLIASQDIKYCYNFPFYTQTSPLPFTMPYGIGAGIKNISATNLFLYLKNKSTKILLTSGLPILHIIPLTEKPIIFKTEVVTNSEYKKYNSIFFRTSFSSAAVKNSKIIKDKKCPFGK